MARKKTWTEKMATPPDPQVKEIDKNFAGLKAGQVVLIPTPKIVADYVRRIPAGAYVDPKQMRVDLAKKHKAEASCPVTTGIFMRIVAEAANEAYETGTPVSRITPIWRVLDDQAPTWKKVSFDPSYMKEQQAAERL